MKDFDKDFNDVFNKEFTESFNKRMEELKKSLSGLDEKIAKQVNSSLDEVNKIIIKFKHKENDDGEEKTEDGAQRCKRKKSGDKFVDMAPYLDDESLHELTKEFLDGDLETDMAEILPFLDEDDVALIMEKFGAGVDEFKGLHAEDLYPYASEESIDKLFGEKLFGGELDEDMASYVSDECWHNIVLKYCNDENCDIDVDAIYPFLNDEDINILFKHYLKKRKNK